MNLFLEANIQDGFLLMGALGILCLVSLLLLLHLRIEMRSLKKAIRLLSRDDVAPRGLFFRISEVSDIWRSVLMLANRVRLLGSDRAALSDVISAASSIAGASDGVAATAEAVVDLLLRQAGPSVSAAAVVLRSPETRALRIEHIKGIPKSRVETSLLICFDRIFDSTENEQNRLWGYHDSLSEPAFDFSVFGLGMSLLVPLRNAAGKCGGIWIGFREGACPLTSGRRAFVQAVCQHAAACFYAAQKVQQKTGEIDREKNFLLGMSHDLRAPGNSALYALRDLLSGELGSLSAEQHLRLSVIEQDLEEQLNMLGDILDFSKHQKGALKARASRTDVPRVVRSALEGFKLAAERKGLVLREGDCEALEAWVDPRHLKRIIVNLLSNAVKYTDHGTVTVSLKRSEKYAVIEVVDTGIGISEAEVASLFCEFSRLESGHDRPGVGLGLALVKALAELNNGFVKYERAIHGGSVFSVGIPLPEDRQDGSSLNPIARFRSILVVDDEPAACRTNIRYLRDIAGTLIPAESMREAVRIASELKPDLIVTDLNLGDGTAVELLNALSERELNIPTLVISGSNGMGLAENLGLNHDRLMVMEKPLDRQDLRTAVMKLATACGGRRTHCA